MQSVAPLRYVSVTKTTPFEGKPVKSNKKLGKKTKSQIALHDLVFGMTPTKRERFAKKLGVTVRYLIKLTAPDVRPGPVLALKIDQATKGEISKESMRPDIYKA